MDTGANRHIVCFRASVLKVSLEILYPSVPKFILACICGGIRSPVLLMSSCFVLLKQASLAHELCQNETGEPDAVSSGLASTNGCCAVVVLLEEGTQPRYFRHFVTHHGPPGTAGRCRFLCVCKMQAAVLDSLIWVAVT